MSESRDIFRNRIDKIHVQREEMNDFYKLVQEGCAISGLDDVELDKLIEDLNNDCVVRSNDMVIEMIIDDVMKNNNDTVLNKLLQNINIGYVSNDMEVIGRAYPKYFDESYYIEVGENICKKMLLLSDIFGVLFMPKNSSNFIEKIILEELLHSTIIRFQSGDEYPQPFNQVQLHMISYDKLSMNGCFTDHYVAYSREIYEMALAFFIGHEIGHHYLKHTDKSIKNEQQPKVKELMADLFAVDFAFKFMQNSYFSDNGFYGIHQFCGVFVPLIASSCFCKNIFEDDKNHPSIVHRIHVIQQKVKGKICEDAWTDVNEYISNLMTLIRFGNADN